MKPQLKARKTMVMPIYKRSVIGFLRDQSLFLRTINIHILLSSSTQLNTTNHQETIKMRLPKFSKLRKSHWLLLLKFSAFSYNLLNLPKSLYACIINNYLLQFLVISQQYNNPFIPAREFAFHTQSIRGRFQSVARSGYHFPAYSDRQRSFQSQK